MRFRILLFGKATDKLTKASPIFKKIRARTQRLTPWFFPGPKSLIRSAHSWRLAIPAGLLASMLKIYSCAATQRQTKSKAYLIRRTICCNDDIVRIGESISAPSLQFLVMTWYHFQNSELTFHVAALHIFK